MVMFEYSECVYCKKRFKKIHARHRACDKLECKAKLIQDYAIKKKAAEKEKKQNPPPPPTFAPGDEIEFLSGDGRWKPGVIDSLIKENCFENRVRIHVGNKIFIIRPLNRCRKREHP